MPLRPKLVDIGILVSENVELLQGNAKQKQIAILLDGIDSKIAFVDSNMITTVVRNLLSNAIKFTPVNGEIHITISDKGDMWLVSVTDTGIGIAPEDQKRLFKIDSNPTTIGTQQEKGTGLGLILCKEFVERNGGVIGLESVPNMGSRFYFTVPKSDYSDTLN
jgi:signal transduction histidine kinase